MKSKTIFIIINVVLVLLVVITILIYAQELTTNNANQINKHNTNQNNSLYLHKDLLGMNWLYTKENIDSQPQTVGE